MTDFRHTTTVSWSGTGNSTFGGTLVDTGDAEDNREVVIASSTEQQVDIAWVRARLQHLFIMADQNLSIATNQAATGTPGDTLAVVANYPVSYSRSAGQTVPMNSADVTALFVTNATSSSATLRIRILKDSTV